LAPDGGTRLDAGCHVDAGPLDPVAVALGKALLVQYQCQNCHGLALTGNFDGVPSPTAVGGTAYPPNLTPDDATGIGCWSDEQLMAAILSGVDDTGAALCAPMPEFGDAGMSDADAWTIAQFLRSLHPIHFVVPATPACPNAVPDSGTAPDAGPLHPDGGHRGDGGTRADAGPDVDAGAVDSGGPAADAGTGSDAGPDADAGDAPDGGTDGGPDGG